MTPRLKAELADYELIDFGEGRKLESLCGYVIDRPSPAANEAHRSLPTQWPGADAYFDEVTKRWLFKKPWPNAATIAGTGFRLPLRPTPFGHIGAFPEQHANWTWLSGLSTLLRTNHHPLDNTTLLRGMNLFAHTGGSTFALAASGMEVAHVDAAKPNVQAAKEAAAASGLDSAPIRYLVDDAAKFTAREVRRAKRYNVIVLDPPAYGHSPHGKAWRIERDLWPLFDDCLQLLCPNAALLITGHSATITPSMLVDYLRTHDPFTALNMHVESGRSTIRDRSGRKLDAGFYVRALWLPSQRGIHS